MTGVVAIACGRHGCYAPNAVVDLFKGEQQKNVDFALCKALMSTGVTAEQGCLLIYDIVCQYIKYLEHRIGRLLPVGLTVDAAIGLFHVHAHQDKCFFQYAPSFIPGAAVISGEILESLWSSLNTISPTARTATLAHRAEMLDDHASDSNHKKSLGIVRSLSKLHRTAREMRDNAQIYYDNLTTQAGPLAVEKWTRDIEEAEGGRRLDVSAMDIYAAKLDSRPTSTGHRIGSGGAGLPQDHWMALFLTVEGKQYV